MERMKRRAFVGAAATSLVAVSGCTYISNVINGRKMRNQINVITAKREGLIKGQPTFESAPTAEAWLVTDPEWMDTNINWEILTVQKSWLRHVQNNLNSETFVTAFVGVLPAPYEFRGYGDPYIKNRTVHISPKAENVGYPDSPDRYRYEFVLWRLLRHTKQPTEMEFNPDFGDLSPSNQTEASE